MPKFSEMSDGELNEYLGDAFRRAHDAVDCNFSHDEHPIHSVREWAATVAAGGAPGRGRAEDNPPEFPGKPANPKLLSEHAQDSADALALKIARIRRENPHNVESAIWQATADHNLAQPRTNGPRVEIKGLDRVIGRDLGGGKTRML
jgi:hypothetical protein